MRQSIVVNSFGGPEQLELISEDSLPLLEKTVRIQIKAIGVNRADILLRSGSYHSAKLPARPGLEASGLVIETASVLFPVGSRVLVFANRNGLYTSETVAEESQICLIPESVSFEQAASLPINWLTAWYCINNLIELKSGETILIPAAASGVGLAAIQIAKHLGAKIIAAASTKEKLEMAKSCGAEFCVNYKENNLIETVQAITSSQGVNTFLDVVGGTIFSQGLKVLAPFGRVAALANVSLEDSLINTRDFYPKNAKIFGFQYGSLVSTGRYSPAIDMKNILDLVSKKVFAPQISNQFSLAKVAQAHQLLETREVIGKLILIPDVV